MSHGRRWIVVGLVALALLGTVVVLGLRSEIGISEVWRTDAGTEIRDEPGGDVLNGYVLMPCTDPSGMRVDYVARLGPAWPDPKCIHRLDETGTVVEAGGERWRRFLVRQEGITPEEVWNDLHK